MATIQSETIKDNINKNGFEIIDAVYSNEEVNELLQLIENVDTSKPTFRKTTDLFAIRQFLKEIPETLPVIFNDKLKTLIRTIFGKEYFIVKSIYFDKPANSNWFVPYHQDLTISVDKKLTIDGFGPWSTKQNQFAVQPPLRILEENFTIRIHLDETNEDNGALKVICASHNKGIYRPETINKEFETETICLVKRGGIMFMKPLLLHASGRTTNDHKRRVIHIEFSKAQLPEALEWAEYFEIFLETSV